MGVIMYGLVSGWELSELPNCELMLKQKAWGSVPCWEHIHWRVIFKTQIMPNLLGTRWVFPRLQFIISFEADSLSEMRMMSGTDELLPIHSRLTASRQDIFSGIICKITWRDYSFSWLMPFSHGRISACRNKEVRIPKRVHPVCEATCPGCTTVRLSARCHRIPLTANHSIQSLSLELLHWHLCRSLSVKCWRRMRSCAWVHQKSWAEHLPLASLWLSWSV